MLVPCPPKMFYQGARLYGLGSLKEANQACAKIKGKGTRCGCTSPTNLYVSQCYYSASQDCILVGKESHICNNGCKRHPECISASALVSVCSLMLPQPCFFFFCSSFFFFFKCRSLYTGCAAEQYRECASRALLSKTLFPLIWKLKTSTRYLSHFLSISFLWALSYSLFDRQHVCKLYQLHERLCAFWQ